MTDLTLEERQEFFVTVFPTASAERLLNLSTEWTDDMIRHAETLGFG